MLLEIVFGHRSPVGGNTSPPLYHFVSAEMYAFSPPQSAADVAQRAKCYLIKTCSAKDPVRAPTSRRGDVTNCSTFIIDTLFNVLRGFSPVRPMVTRVENKPGLCVFQSARPCPGQRCGQTSLRKKVIISLS